MNKIAALIICTLLCVALAGCSAAPDIEALDRAETYQSTPAALATVYTSVAELQKDAQLIAEVEVTGTEVIPLDGLPRTHSQATVTALLKGTLDVGSEIEVIEEGGGDAVAGVPPMEAGNRYVLFLTEHEGAYYILGAFQGKFIEKEGYVFQQSTEDVKLETYEPMTIEGFIEAYSA